MECKGQVDHGVKHKASEADAAHSPEEANNAQSQHRSNHHKEVGDNDLLPAVHEDRKVLHGQPEKKDQEATGCCLEQHIGPNITPHCRRTEHP